MLEPTLEFVFSVAAKAFNHTPDVRQSQQSVTAGAELQVLGAQRPWQRVNRRHSGSAESCQTALQEKCNGTETGGIRTTQRPRGDLLGCPTAVLKRPWPPNGRAPEFSGLQCGEAELTEM